MRELVEDIKIWDSVCRIDLYLILPILGKKGHGRKGEKVTEAKVKQL